MAFEVLAKGKIRLSIDNILQQVLRVSDSKITIFGLDWVVNSQILISNRVAVYFSSIVAISTQDIEIKILTSQ